MSVTFDRQDNTDFHGAKLALFVGNRLVTILRDDKPDIPWPAHWDMPGGGREGTETGVQCVLRETHEELSLLIPDTALTWGRLYERKGLNFWFFAAQVPATAVTDLQLGTEGQCYELIAPRDYLIRERAIPQFQERLSHCLADLQELSI